MKIKSPPRVNSDLLINRLHLKVGPNVKVCTTIQPLLVLEGTSLDTHCTNGQK